ncbi:hypothetical protein SAMN02745119_03357 [Trichlorobacter thiogenes]|uniref:Uncharacterized protein n=1 Tax=Trichlorobacter thiogenes TaxID=115783 RepID=A0A1T4S9W8_9BACT|nr:major capsid protein [Trichlorobacter thiogenes]SKA25023.1 hypothetical protein SAMN02745119_03357 [Trichlorobacter thiogenes]
MKKLSVVLSAVAATAVAAAPSFAALSAADQTAIQAGITGSDAVFFAIGGTILTVLAGIWGFKKVQSLMGR